MGATARHLSYQYTQQQASNGGPGEALVFQNDSTVDSAYPVPAGAPSRVATHIGNLDSFGLNLANFSYMLPRTRGIDKYFLDDPNAKGASRIGSSGRIWKTAAQQAVFTYGPVEHANQLYAYERFPLFPASV